MHLWTLFKPRTGTGWCASLALAGLVLLVLGQASKTGLGQLLLVACAIGGAKLYQLSGDRAELWLEKPIALRSAILALTAYVLMVTLGNTEEISGLDNWTDFLLLQNGASLSFGHLVGVAVGIALVLRQRREDGPMEVPLDYDRILRGRILIEFEVAQERANQLLGEPKPDDCLNWAMVPLARSRGVEHFCLIGGPGSGKTQLMLIFEKSVLRKFTLGSNRRAIVYDAKRDMNSILAGMNLPCEVISMNVFDKRGAAWDMAADIENGATAMEIATILMPEQNSSQPFFTEAGRGLFAGVMEAFTVLSPGRWTLRDVILVLRSGKRLKDFLSLCEDTKFLVEKYLLGNDMSSSVEATVQNVVRRLAFVAAGWEHATQKISLKQWLETESVLLLGSDPTLEGTMRQLNAAILKRSSQLILSQSEARRESRPRETWIFVDELRDAGKLDGLDRLLVAGRSKGAAVFLGFQDMPGLREVYGRNVAEELIGLCGNIGFLRQSEPDTAEYGEKYFGKQDVEQVRYVRNAGRSVARSQSGNTVTDSGGWACTKNVVTRPVVTSGQLQGIPKADFTIGVGGYFNTLAVGDLYLTHVPGDFLEKHAPRSAEQVFDFELRPYEQLRLLPWRQKDLERLRLTAHPQLLVDDGKPIEPPPTPEPPKTGSGWDQLDLNA